MRLVLQSLCDFFPPSGTLLDLSGPFLSAGKGVFRYSVPKWLTFPLLHVGSGFHCLRSFSFMILVCALTTPIHLTCIAAGYLPDGPSVKTIVPSLLEAKVCLASRFPNKESWSADLHIPSSFAEAWEHMNSSVQLLCQKKQCLIVLKHHTI